MKPTFHLSTSKLSKQLCYGLISLLIVLIPAQSQSKEQTRVNGKAYFVLDDSTNLRELGGPSVSSLLNRVQGRGNSFGAAQKERYCALKQNDRQVQWAVNDLDTGRLISRSENADSRFFGASVSKLFVAAALLDKQRGELSKTQLRQLVKMIVVSDNGAWKELQRQTGFDGSNDSGREAVNKFVLGMGYDNTRGFQGWWRTAEGSRIHGNELNALELSEFLYDTYQGNYSGAEVLWKVMQATRTGRSKVDKYTPRSIYIGGKTGTYHGPNSSPETIHHVTVKARNHAAVLNIDGRHYGVSILTNTGTNEDVAVLGGGLMREYLGVEGGLECI